MAAIREELKLREKADTRYAALEKEKLARIAKANPLPAGQTGKIATLPLGKPAAGKPQLLVVTLGNATLKIRVQKPIEPVATGD